MEVVAYFIYKRSVTSRIWLNFVNKTGLFEVSRMICAILRVMDLSFIIGYAIYNKKRLLL